MTNNREKKLKILCLCILFFLIVLVCTLIVFIQDGTPQPSIVYHIGSLRVPYINIYLTYIGFILPLIISIIFLIIYIKKVAKVVFHLDMVFLLVMIFFGIISYFTPSLQFVEIGVGSHENPIVFISAIGFWGFLIIQNFQIKSSDAFLWLSYPIFFLAGAISDFDSLAIFHGGSFGGGFLYDGDFLFPLIFLIPSTVIWCLNNRKVTSVPTS